MPNVQIPYNHLSRRMEGVSESATLKLNARVGELKAQGVDVVNLTAGEPDFAVPEAAKIKTSFRVWNSHFRSSRTSANNLSNSGAR